MRGGGGASRATRTRRGRTATRRGASAVRRFTRASFRTGAETAAGVSGLAASGPGLAASGWRAGGSVHVEPPAAWAAKPVQRRAAMRLLRTPCGMGTSRKMLPRRRCRIAKDYTATARFEIWRAAMSGKLLQLKSLSNTKVS